MQDIALNVRARRCAEDAPLLGSPHPPSTASKTVVASAATISRQSVDLSGVCLCIWFPNQLDDRLHVLDYAFALLYRIEVVDHLDRLIGMLVARILTSLIRYSHLDPGRAEVVRLKHGWFMPVDAAGANGNTMMSIEAGNAKRISDVG